MHSSSSLTETCSPSFFHLYSETLKEAGITDSAHLIRNLLRTTIFNINYIKELFPGNHSVSALEMKIKNLIPVDAKSRRLIDWIDKGAHNDLQKEYLKMLLFCVCEGVDGPMIEESAFSFSYIASEKEEVSMNINSTGHEKQGGTFKHNSITDITPQQMRSSACKGIQSLVQLMRTLEKLPEEHKILMKLLQIEDVMMFFDMELPPDYEPLFFQGCTEEAYHQWAKNPLKMEVTDVNSKRFFIALKVKSLFDRCDDGNEGIQDEMRTIDASMLIDILSKFRDISVVKSLFYPCGDDNEGIQDDKSISEVDGEAYMWGKNTNEQLGLGKSKNLYKNRRQKQRLEKGDTSRSTNEEKKQRKKNKKKERRQKKKQKTENTSEDDNNEDNNEESNATTHDSTQIQGKKKALYICVDTIKGCDKKLVALLPNLCLLRVLVQNLGFEDDELLCDMLEYAKPNSVNIVNSVDNFIRTATAGDNLMIYFAGHSMAKPPRLVTIDGKSILAEPFWSRNLSLVPKGATMTLILDTCHAGEQFGQWEKLIQQHTGGDVFVFGASRDNVTRGGTFTRSLCSAMLQAAEARKRLTNYEAHHQTLLEMLDRFLENKTTVCPDTYKLFPKMGGGEKCFLGK